MDVCETLHCRAQILEVFLISEGCFSVVPDNKCSDEWEGCRCNHGSRRWEKSLLPASCFTTLRHSTCNQPSPFPHTGPGMFTYSDVLFWITFANLFIIAILPIKILYKYGTFNPLTKGFWDNVWQVMGLTALGIAASMLTSSTTKDEEKSIYKALEKGEGDLRILYVTPEKVAKSKRFVSKLEKCNHGGRLSLIAIDVSGQDLLYRDPHFWKVPVIWLGWAPWMKATTMVLCSSCLNFAGSPLL